MQSRGDTLGLLDKVGWSSVSSVFFIVVQSLILLYVSYQVSPSELAYYFLASAAYGFGLTLIDAAFNSSILSRKNIDEVDLQSVFSLNFYASCILCIIFLIISALLIKFGSNNLLAGLLSAFALLLIIQSSISTQISALKHHLQFRQLAILEILSSIDYIITFFFCMWLGLGVWSLVIALWVKLMTSLVYLWIYTPRYFNYKILPSHQTRNHWEFSKYILAERLTSSVLSYIDVIVISSIIGIMEFGVYELLKRIILRPILILYSGIEQVFLPLLSQSSENQFRFRFNLFSKLSSWIFISYFAIVAINNNLIIQLFAEPYQAYGNILLLIAIFGAVIIVLNPLDIIMYSQLKSRIFFKWILSYSPLVVLIYFITAHYGLEFMLMILIIFYIIIFLLAYPFMIQKSPLSFYDYSFVLLFSSIIFSIIWIANQYFDSIYTNFILSLIIGLYALIRLLQIRNL